MFRRFLNIKLEFTFKYSHGGIILGKFEIFMNRWYKYLAVAIVTLITLLNMYFFSFSILTYIVALFFLRFIFKIKRRNFIRLILLLFAIIYITFMMTPETKVVASTELPKYMAILILVNLPLLSYLLYDDMGDLSIYVFNFILYALYATIYMDLIVKIYNELPQWYGIPDIIALVSFALYFQLLMFEDMIKIMLVRHRKRDELDDDDEDDFKSADSFI